MTLAYFFRMAGSTDYIVMLLTGDDTETYRSGCKNLPSGYDFLVENESPLKFGNPKKLAHQKIIILVVMLGHPGWGNVTQPVGTDLNKPLLACIKDPYEPSKILWCMPVTLCGWDVVSCSIYFLSMAVNV